MSSIDPTPTLGQFFESFIRPHCFEAAGLSPLTIESYAWSIALWCQLTGDPPLHEIDQATCSAFTRRLRERTNRDGKPISSRTINLHVKNLRKCFRLAGPASEARNPLGQDLIDRVPYLQTVRNGRIPARPGLTIVELESWWDTVATARTPIIPGIRPADWWRAWLLFAYNTAFRIKATLKLQWSMIDGEWIDAPAAIMKLGAAGRFYLNTTARRALEKIRTASDRVLSWPYRVEQFHRSRRLVLDQDNHADRRKWTAHALRRTVLSWLAERNLAAAVLTAGHTGKNVLVTHYVSPRIVIPWLEQLPQPRQAAEWLESPLEASEPAPVAPLLLTAGQVARRLGVSINTVWRRRQDGVLPGLTIGTAVRWRARDVDTIIHGKPHRNGTRPPAVLTVGQAAQLLGLCTRTVAELRDKGQLPCRRDGRQLRFSLSDIEHFIDSKTKARHEQV